MNIFFILIYLNWPVRITINLFYFIYYLNYFILALIFTTTIINYFIINFTKGHLLKRNQNLVKANHSILNRYYCCYFNFYYLLGYLNAVLFPIDYYGDLLFKFMENQLNYFTKTAATNLIIYHPHLFNFLCYYFF